MEVLSFCPLRTASFTWRPRHDAHACTVLCKATFKLAPGLSPLEHEQELIWQDDGGSLQAMSDVSDMVPFKRHVDVFVMGSAHAYTHRSTSVTARLQVGTLVRSVEARQDAGLSIESLGPISPTAKARRALLGRHASTWDHRGWRAKPLPSDFDAAYFNAAPLEQQLPELTGDESITLDNLHPTHPKLVTKLMRVDPRVTARRADHAVHDVRLRCDTLVIDALHGRAMVVWRGIVQLAREDESGLLLVSMGETDATGTVALVHDVAASAGGVALPFVAGMAPVEIARGMRSESHARHHDPTGTVVLSRGGELHIAADAISSSSARKERQLELTEVAVIAAELAEAPSERARTLERHGLREEAWRQNERRWTAAIDAETAQGHHDLRAAHDAAYVARVESFRGPIELGEYVRVVVALERGAVDATLEALHIHREALMPIVRAWTRKVARDMKLGDAATLALRAARRV